MLRNFNLVVFFRKLIGVVFQLSWFCSVQLTFFCTVASSKVLYQTAFDTDTKSVDTEIFPQYTIADLNSDITFIVLFSQEKPL